MLTAPESPGDYTFEDWLRGYVRSVDVDIRGKDRAVASGKHFSASIVYHKKLAIETLAPSPSDRILDLGCANGATTLYCSMLGATCIGVDLSFKAVKQGNDYLRQRPVAGAQLFVADAGMLPFARASFDKAVSCDLYEHLDHYTKLRVLRETYRVLKPGGFLLLKTPNLTYLKLSLAFKRLRAVLRLNNPFKLVVPHTRAADGHAAEHIGLATVFQVERDLRSAGFFSAEFHYGLSTKLPRLPMGLNRFAHQECPVVRDVLVEEVLVKATKSRLSDMIPD